MRIATTVETTKIYKWMHIIITLAAFFKSFFQDLKISRWSFQVSVAIHWDDYLLHCRRLIFYDDSVSQAFLKPV